MTKAKDEAHADEVDYVLELNEGGETGHEDTDDHAEVGHETDDTRQHTDEKREIETYHPQSRRVNRRERGHQGQLSAQKFREHRIDLTRIREGILRCKEKSGHFFGYDFTGMFALWNENLKPEKTDDFGTEYICSTSVVALLYIGGFESDSTPRQGLDLVTPYQVVRAKGRFVKPPPLLKED